MTLPFLLTRRGKGMILGGAAVGVMGIAGGSTAVAAAGLFAVIVVALCVCWVLLRRSGTTLGRSAVPIALRAGEGFTVAAVIGARQLHAGHALIEGLLPGWAGNGSDSASAVIRIAAGSNRLVQHGCGHRRGLHEWPVLRVELPDPLGVAHGIITTSPPGRTVVFPRIEPLGPARIAAITGGVSELDDATVLARAGLGDPGGNPIPRPYQPGDGLRRMHWPATAKAGEPMVRAEDGRPVRRAVVLLDCTRGGYLGDEGFERAVSAAASIAVRLLQLGWAVSVRLSDGAVLGQSVWSEGRRGEFDILAALAAVSIADSGRQVRPQPQDPEDAAYAVTGGGQEPAWCMPALLTIRTEVPAVPGEGDHEVVWSAGDPLDGVWTSGATRLVAR